MIYDNLRQQEIERLEKLLDFYKTHATIYDLAKRYGVSQYTIEKW